MLLVTSHLVRREGKEKLSVDLKITRSIATTPGKHILFVYYTAEQNSGQFFVFFQGVNVFNSLNFMLRWILIK